MRTDHSAPDDLVPERVETPVASGGVLSGHLWSPGGAPRASLVVHPATATPEGFYHPFARFAAQQGVATLTYNYRGVGSDARVHRHLRMRDWLLEDAPTATALAAQRFAGVPQVAVGHSLGGHALLLGAGGDQVTRFASVASHLAAMSAIPSRSERLRVAAILGVIGPGLGRALGYVPGRRMGLGEDVPVAALREWSGWTRLPAYFYDDPSFDARTRAEATTARILAVGVDDDPWSVPAAIDALVAAAAGPVERRQYSPADLGQERVGHHGLFRRAAGARFWPELLDWLTRAD